ncbi:MAG: hypothetical protein LVT47_00385 [Cyanobacteria bacterium LVE1205-1]|jgi:hypothetical protein
MIALWKKLFAFPSSLNELQFTFHELRLHYLRAIFFDYLGFGLGRKDKFHAFSHGGHY